MSVRKTMMGGVEGGGEYLRDGLESSLLLLFLRRLSDLVSLFGSVKEGRQEESASRATIETTLKNEGRKGRKV